MAFPGLKKNCDHLLQQNNQQTSSFNPEFVNRCYQVGGKDFVEAIKKYGVNERGSNLNLLPWHCEYAELISDFRVAEILTSGAAQLGKTLMHTLLLCYCLTEGGLNTLWSYDQERSLNVQVPSNFRPVIDQWTLKRGIKNVRQDAKNNTIYQVRGATAQFVYVSTSKLKEQESGKAAAGGIAVGVSRDILFKEERSQYPLGASDPLNRRLDAGRLPSRPIRELGTPGSGNGIESEIELADYKFYPHYDCPHCGVSAPLHPKGCLLIADKSGDSLSKSGRPIDWHRNSEGEAMFGCSNCGEKLGDEIRSNSKFKCVKTGIYLRDFLDGLPKGKPKKRIKAGIILSPLLRIRSSNLAQELVDEGLKTLNTDDWQQQALGEPSVTSGDSVTLEMLKTAIFKRFELNRKPDFTLCGIDQGRAEYWLWKCQYYLPEDWEELPFIQRIEQAHRVVVFGGDIMKGEVADHIADCDFGIIDNEPDISASVALSSSSNLNLADQQTGLLDAVKEGIVREGGNEHPCWKIRNEKFLKSVLTAFLMERYNLPQDWEQWLGRPTERSPLVHLTAPTYNPETGRWKRPKNHVDDLYYAAMFCEVAFYIHLSSYSPNSIFEVGEEREIFESISKF